MVIGNPSTGKTTLAKRLVKEMRCQYIHATELIEQNMRENTLLGEYCAEQLLSGRTIANKTLVALLKGAISLPECQHYGYVMDSFPTYLAFDEQIELVENLALKPDFVIHIEIPDDDLRKRLESQRIDPIDGTIYNYYNLEDPPGPFIKLVSPAAPHPNPETIIEEGEGQIPDMDDILMEEGGIDEVYGKENLTTWHPEFPRLTKEVTKRLLFLPEDSQRELDRLFNLNKNKVQKSLKQFLRKFPRTHVIKIDGNCPPTQMFYNLMIKVRALSIRPAIPPYHLSLKNEDKSEEDEEEPEKEEEDRTIAEAEPRTFEKQVGERAISEADVDDGMQPKGEKIDWDAIITTLVVRKMPTEHSRWQMSEWQRFCPVQLYNGILEYGKVEFACGFLGCLYFLSCREALKSFIRNPRPYLDFQISQPKFTVRIAVMGFQKSGSTALCRLLADRHGAICISLTEILREELDAKLKETLEMVKAEVETDVVEKLNNQRKREIEEIKTNNYADNALMKLMADTINTVAEEALENLDSPKAMENKIDDRCENVNLLPEGLADGRVVEQGHNQRELKCLRSSVCLKEVLTPGHPQVVEAVTRALRFAKAQPNYLNPKRYVDTLVEELARLDHKNRNVISSKRKPLSWVIEGLPPLEEVWQELKKRSRSVAKEISYVRQAFETVHKLERAMQRRELNKKAKEEEEEAMMEGEAGGGDDGTAKKSLKREESANPYAKKLDPRLVKAREVADEAASRVIPLDPMPSYVFKLRDDLPDYALMIHRLYAVGFGPLEELPTMFKAEGIDESAIEPMVTTETSEREPSKDKSGLFHDDEDAMTEPPEDPPTSGQTFYPMPQPGPEVDCVRDQLIQFDKAWEASKQGLSQSITAYGFPVHVQDLSIHKDKTLDNLLEEVNNEFEKLFAFTAKESSQEMLDEEIEAETEGFEETGGLEGNLALEEADEAEMEEEKEEEEEEEEEEGEGEEEREGATKESEEEEEEKEAEEDLSRGPNRKLGQTSYFCPVAYHDYHVLKPGDSELVATYKGLSYYLGSEKDMAKFMANPEKYVGRGYQPPLKPPPLRIALLGPPGTGKTLHGRQIASQLDLIHVSFDQMLQDVMMQKLKHRIGPEYEDDKEIPVKVMPNLEEAVAKVLWQLENPKAPVQVTEEEAATAPPTSAEVTDEGEAFSPEDNLTPHELAIRRFLENDEALPETSLNLLLPRLWQEEPYRSKGFILESFPRSAGDVTYMLEANLLVDFAIVLNAEVGDLVPRLLPALLAKWKVKVAKVEANRKIVADWKAQKRKRIREERRKMIINSLNEKRIARY
uniref:Adenylate kinase 9 n=1 Tax=Echinococcus canadensis TaxID=519352 RepID=A0A915EUU8_9CEST